MFQRKQLLFYEGLFNNCENVQKCFSTNIITDFFIKTFYHFCSNAQKKTRWSIKTIGSFLVLLMTFSRFHRAQRKTTNLRQEVCGAAPACGACYLQSNLLNLEPSDQICFEMMFLCRPFLTSEVFQTLVKNLTVK